ncbi:peptide chain release factor N(5)-glutamine methyltransferase [Candidatus Erwinia haradaeae]|uniref:Release factor glutamine methyltransferase n=1 Tax=Candidatus Erwinia haradaeae TaxID=1922217 RepID=A0A803GCU9_9GAMM|nr:peptide chain release factor N(5)-glutamine methyltransferase [Candidatus Erwinia haradaeae]VFP88273.1 Release factor glutamine methyltransferase [Candidatus Erwinia haradaeae]
MKISHWIDTAMAQLINSTSPKLDAEILLSMVIKKPRSWIIAFDDSLLTTPSLRKLKKLLQQRAIGTPISYLTGEREFWSMTFNVTPNVLIPRADSEILVEKALTLIPLNKACSILDLGTGCGAIAIAIASEREDCQVLGIDNSIAAIKVAKQNAISLGYTNVSFIPGNWFSTIGKRQFYIIVSNPPYINISDEHLLKEDIRFEPMSALISSDNGLADIKCIVKQAKYYLISGGWLLIEHGWKQAEYVRTILEGNGFCQVQTSQDYSGNDRITFGLLY